jgi:predicted nucleotidyltransferase
LPIPPLQPSGILPAGIHECSLEEIEHGLTYNDRRREIWSGWEVIKERLVVIPEVEVVYIDGSFISDKPEPSDIDVAVEFFNIESYYKVRDRHQDLFWKRERVKDQYKVDIQQGFIHCPKEEFNAIEWFQVLSRKEAALRRVPLNTRKGILKVRLK